MTLTTFNLSLLIGWIIASVGGVWWFPPAGLVGSGLALIGLTFMCARLGGVMKA